MWCRKGGCIMDYQHRLSANTNVSKIQVVLKVLNGPRTGLSSLQTEILQFVKLLPTH